MQEIYQYNGLSHSHKILTFLHSIDIPNAFATRKQGIRKQENRALRKKQASVGVEEISMALRIHRWKRTIRKFVQSLEPNVPPNQKLHQLKKPIGAKGDKSDNQLAGHSRTKESTLIEKFRRYRF